MIETPAIAGADGTCGAVHTAMHTREGQLSLNPALTTWRVDCSF
jgi:hypothetical protein